MRTTLRSNTGEDNIYTEGPIVVIGEKINPTGHRRLAEEMQAVHWDYVSELATAQVAAGADVLDINACVPGLDEVALVTKVVKMVSSTVNVSPFASIRQIRRPFLLRSLQLPVSHWSIQRGVKRPYYGKCSQWSKTAEQR